MADLVFAAIIIAGMYFALKYIHRERHCKHNCSECRHPCRTRT